MRKKGFVVPDKQRLRRKIYLERYRTGEEYMQRGKNNESEYQ
jgi:hypothetical protein